MKARWALLLALPAGIGGWYGLQSHDETRLTFLAVGQGDCIVLQTEGRTLLIDTGPASDQWDAARAIVRPRLRALGVTQVDAVLLTHPDMDHVGGLPTLLRAFPRTRIMVPGGYRTDPEMRGRLAEWRIPSERVDWLPEHSDLKVGATRLEMFSPPYSPTHSNDGSLMLRVSRGEAHAVLTGDAPFESEWLALHHGSWRAEVLKAGHHGSRGSTSNSFLDAVKPTWLVVSCGRDNRYGHPAPETLERAKQHQVQVARTDREGDITFVVQDGRFQRLN